MRDLQPDEITYNLENGQEFLTFHYPNGILVHHNHPGMGNLQVTGTPGEKKPAKTVPSYKGNGGIYGDFLHCVKTREKPFRDIEYGVNTIALATWASSPTR